MTNIIKNKNKNKKRGNKIKSTFRNKKKNLRTSSIKNNVKIKNNNKKKIIGGGDENKNDNATKLEIQEKIHSDPEYNKNFQELVEIPEASAPILTTDATDATDATDDDSNKTGDSKFVSPKKLISRMGKTRAPAAGVAAAGIADSSKKNNDDDDDNGNDKPQGEKSGMFSGMFDRFKNKDPSKPGMFSKMFGSKSKNTDSSSDPIIQKQDCFTSEDTSTNQIVITIPSKAAGVEVINNIKMDDKLKAIAELAVEPNKEPETAAASESTAASESQTGGRLNKSKRNRRFQLRKRSRKRNRGKNNKK